MNSYFSLILFLFILYLLKKNYIEYFTIQDYLGKTYNYPKRIKTPKSLSVSSTGNLFVIPKNINALKHYSKTLGYGNKSLGDKYFIKSGKCNKEKSVNECKGKDRWIFINNLPKLKKGGLIPGIMDDVSYINPIEITNILMGGENQPYSTNCYLRREKVETNRQYFETKCSIP